MRLSFLKNNHLTNPHYKVKGDMKDTTRLKIKRKYKGDEFMYYVYVTNGSYKCHVRQVCTDNETTGIISCDFKYIILDKGFEIKGINGEAPKTLNRLTISRIYSRSAKDAILALSLNN